MKRLRKQAAVASGRTSQSSPGLDPERDRKEGKNAKAILLALNPELRARVCAQKPRDLAVTVAP